MRALSRPVDVDSPHDRRRRPPTLHPHVVTKNSLVWQRQLWQSVYSLPRLSRATLFAILSVDRHLARNTVWGTTRTGAAILLLHWPPSSASGRRCTNCSIDRFGRATGNVFE